MENGIMERHTTRGGWKPVKHERILKPDFQKDENQGSVTPFHHKYGFSANPDTKGYHGKGREKLG